MPAFEVGDIVEIVNWHPDWNGFACVISVPSRDEFYDLVPLPVIGGTARFAGGFGEEYLRLVCKREDIKQCP